jgi:hypothetical protein
MMTTPSQKAMGPMSGNPAKKMGVQMALRANCQMNSRMPAVRAGLDGIRHARQNDTPINTYKTDHTGPNTQFGGVHGAVLASAYQPSTLPAVDSAPSPPMMNGTAMLMANASP